MRRTLSRIINLIIAISVLLAWLYMIFKPGRHGEFSAERLWNLKYFTVLSNLFQGAISLAYGLGRRPRRLKYIATVAVGLTFFTVLLFLGPAYGYKTSYTGANFWYHLVVPLLAMLDFLFLDRDGTFTLRDSFRTMLPMLAYSLFYIGNLAINGMGRGADTNDWYGFAFGGPKSTIIIFLALLVSNWVIALLLRLPRRESTL